MSFPDLTKALSDERQHDLARAADRRIGASQPHDGADEVAPGWWHRQRLAWPRRPAPAAAPAPAPAPAPASIVTNWLSRPRPVEPARRSTGQPCPAGCSPTG